MRIVEAPLTKVTLNLYTADYEYLKQRFTFGYTEIIRDEIKIFVASMKEEDKHAERNRPFDGEVG